MTFDDLMHVICRRASVRIRADQFEFEELRKLVNSARVWDATVTITEPDLLSQEERGSLAVVGEGAVIFDIT